VDAVALAATIGGSVVALAGVGATAWGAKQQRESAKELEESRQEHERQLASGARFSKKLSLPDRHRKLTRLEPGATGANLGCERSQRLVGRARAESSWRRHASYALRDKTPLRRFVVRGGFSRSRGVFAMLKVVGSSPIIRSM
jgi:hypothetical protein